MKKALYALLLGGMLLLAPQLHAQTGSDAPIGYSERVPVEAAEQSRLYTRALAWTEHQFAYAPKLNVKTDATAGTVRLTGTGRLKTVDTKGKDQELPVEFMFQFRATETGYEYSVGSFHVRPNAAQPDQVVALDEYLALLRAERSNARTHNDRRIAAQATSLASEAALSFRSFMNSQPAEGEANQSSEH